MSEPRRPQSLFDQLASRDNRSSLTAIPLVNVGGIATRVYKPPASQNPASRILDDPRSRAQLFQPSPLQRVERWRGQVVFPGMTAAYQNARYRGSSAIGVANVKYGDAGARASATPAVPSPADGLRTLVARVRTAIGL